MYIQTLLLVIGCIGYAGIGYAVGSHMRDKERAPQTSRAIRSGWKEPVNAITRRAERLSAQGDRVISPRKAAQSKIIVE